MPAAAFLASQLPDKIGPANPLVKPVMCRVWKGMSRLVFAFLSVLAMALSARTGDEGMLTLRLVSEVKGIQPGRPFYVGLALHHAPGWHTYWKFPGVVGVPTNLKWQDLPSGFKAEPIDWPEPESVLMFEIKAQGYERDVVLPMKITPPADLKQGTEVTLKGQAAYMCCNRTCHPGFENLSLSLPVAASCEYDETWHGKIEKELAGRPRTSTAWAASVVEGDETMEFTLRPVGQARAVGDDELSKLIFFTEDGLVDSDKPQKIERMPDGSLHFTLAKTSYIVGEKPKTMTGVLVRPGGWEADGGIHCLRVSAALGKS